MAGDEALVYNFSISKKSYFYGGNMMVKDMIGGNQSYLVCGDAKLSCDIWADYDMRELTLADASNTQNANAQLQYILKALSKH